MMLDTRHIMSVLSSDPDTTRPFDSAATHLTCAPDCSDALFDWTPAPRYVRVPAQRRHAPVARFDCHGLHFSPPPHCRLGLDDEGHVDST